jgi:hypothetical protein
MRKIREVRVKVEDGAEFEACWLSFYSQNGCECPVCGCHASRAWSASEPRECVYECLDCGAAATSTHWMGWSE